MSDTPASVCLSKTPVARATPISNTLFSPPLALDENVGTVGFHRESTQRGRKESRCYVKSGEKCGACAALLEF